MSDLINRQAAIDDFYNVKVNEENCNEYDIGYNDGIDYAIAKLAVMPSVQPYTIGTTTDTTIGTTDCISRHGAIDAIRKEYAGIHDANMDGDFLADEIEFIITKLPSVQPYTIGTTTDTTICTTDCISRHGAIDALIRAGKPINNGDGTLTITPLTEAVIREVLTALPSVQERKERKYDS